MACSTLPLPGYSVEKYQKGDGDDREYGFRVFHPRMRRQMYFLCDSEPLSRR